MRTRQKKMPITWIRIVVRVWGTSTSIVHKNNLNRDGWKMIHYSHLIYIILISIQFNTYVQGRLMKYISMIVVLSHKQSSARLNLPPNMKSNSWLLLAWIPRIFSKICPWTTYRYDKETSPISLYLTYCKINYLETFGFESMMSISNIPKRDPMGRW